MNQGQEKFLQFILQNSEEKNHGRARELLNESFAKQDDGTFDQEYMMTFIPRMLELIKPENVEQVKNVMMKHKV